ncbi:hypothetical protein Csa_010883 [Cucumis sativus]|nr:hypothetical protein Csa_010883 [Cucumis sativus]
MASFDSTRTDEDQVLVEEKRFVRLLTLNRTKQLNALSFTMVSRLLELFVAYDEADPSVKLVVVKGKGRAFCAGGDVSAVVHDIKRGKFVFIVQLTIIIPAHNLRCLQLACYLADKSCGEVNLIIWKNIYLANHNPGLCELGDWKKGAYFFRKEFTLNYLLATFSKPQVSLLDGIVMGGGAGVSIHGRFRVATEKSVFAMPETALGLFPDVGASYYLSRLPGFFGEYVGLTGARLDGAEMLACGLATHFVTSEKLTHLEEALCRADTSEPSIISSIIDKFSQRPILKGQSVYHRLDVIDKCFSRRTVEDILAALEDEALKKKDDWITSTIQDLKKASPTSLKISLRSIREGRLQGVGQCLIREYRMVCHVLRGEVSKDFVEGCRAILLDKDRNPKVHKISCLLLCLRDLLHVIDNTQMYILSLELVTDAMVERYFSRIEDEEWEDLKLPARSNLPPSAISKL